MAAGAVRAAGTSTVAFLLPSGEVTDARSVGQALAEGAILAAYQYRDVKSDDFGEFVIIPVGELPTVEFHDALERGVADGVIVGEAINWAKEQINTPAGALTPKDLAKKSVRRFSDYPHVAIASWSESKIEAERLGGLLGVSQGSSQPPRLVYAVYDPEPSAELPHVALVGKGVTFDSGGLSLKSGDGMMTMKTDMTGAATVLAVLGAASQLGAARETHGHRAAHGESSRSARDETGRRPHDSQRSHHRSAEHRRGGAAHSRRRSVTRGRGIA